MTKDKKEPTDWERFDRVMGGLMAVPYSELQNELEEERKRKTEKKKRSKKTAVSREASDS